MRPVERINKFYLHHIFDKLHDDGKLKTSEFVELCQRYEEFRRYWEDNPDQRMFQALINLNICEDSLNRWVLEDTDILIEYNIYLGDILKWRSYYNVDMEPLKEPIDRYIKDMETSHINNVFNYTFKRGGLSREYRYAFLQELERRK